VCGITTNALVARLVFCRFCPGEYIFKGPILLSFQHEMAWGIIRTATEDIPFELRRLGPEDRVERVEIISGGQGVGGWWPRQSILTEKHEIPRPIAVKVVELTESATTAQREAATVFPVGTRVKVLVFSYPTRCYHLYHDGVVIDYVRNGGSYKGMNLRAGSMKVWFDKGHKLKWVSPADAKKQISLFKPEEYCPPMLPFGAIGQLRVNGEHWEGGIKYVELHGGFIQWWDRETSASEGEEPEGQVPLCNCDFGSFDWGNDAFLLTVPDGNTTRVIRFSIRGNPNFKEAPKSKKDQDTNDRLTWMWAFALRAQLVNVTDLLPSETLKTHNFAIAGHTS